MRSDANYRRSNAIREVTFEPGDEARRIAGCILTGSPATVVRQRLATDLCDALCDAAQLDIVRVKISTARQYHRTHGGRVVFRQYAYYKPNAGTPPGVPAGPPPPPRSLARGLDGLARLDIVSPVSALAEPRRWLRSSPRLSSRVGQSPSAHPLLTRGARRDVQRGYVYLNNRTAVRGQLLAARTFLVTLLHEWVHHYDHTALGLRSIHTSGFYARLKSLRTALGA